MHTPEVERARTQSVRQGAVSAATVAAYVALLVAAHVVGRVLIESGQQLSVRVPPLFASPDPHLGPSLLPPVVLAALVVYRGHEIAARLSWPALLAAAFAGLGAWAVLLAITAGWEALLFPVAHEHDAWALLPQMPDAATFLSTFTQRLDQYPVHVQGHPPGLSLLLLGLNHLGLGIRGAVAALYVLAGASIAPAVLIAARATVGEQRARRAAPFVVLAPLALWIATSPDALFSAVAAWGIVLLVCARPGSIALPLAGGAVLGGALLLTYGAAPLLLVPGAIWLARRNVVPLLWAGAGILAVLGIPALFGYFWPEGLLATREHYYEGLGGIRPYGYFVWANLATLAFTIGPAAVRGLVRIGGLIGRGRLGTAATPWIVLSALAAVLAADLSGLSKGEVERIWLLFSPWLVLAAGYLPQRSRRRLWLAAGAAGAIAVEAWITAPW